MWLAEQLRWWAAECDRTNFGCQAKGALLEAAEALEKSAPVVRCKDCKRRIETMKPEYEKGGGICGRMYDTGEIEGYLCRVSADDFCSYGERKDGDV